MRLPAGSHPGAGAVLLCIIFARVTLTQDTDHNNTGGFNDTIPAPSHYQSSLPTYFAHPNHVGLIYAHIFLMLLAWVLTLPLAVMFSLARSRFTLIPQFSFLAANAVGLIFGVLYRAKTPDLYPNNAHSKIGWIVTWLISAQILTGLVGRAGRSVWKVSVKSSGDAQAFARPASYPADDGFRLSGDSGQGTEPLTESLRSHSVSSFDIAVDEEDGVDENWPLQNLSKHYDQVAQDNAQVETTSATSMPSRSGLRAAQIVVSLSIWKYLDLVYQVVDRIALPVGFIALMSGIATLGRFFEGEAIFSGLAHWIKGGVFFWLGLFTLGRWTGSFGDLGWAWNVRPQTKLRKWCPTAELVECALIFSYGSTNIFLEHLGHWGGAWRPQDLEHVAITILFIGGGLCGMLVESCRVRDLLNTTVLEVLPGGELSEEGQSQRSVPETYKLSLNPIPALVILMLGITMSSHQQSSGISSMVHKQWGNLLLGASCARGLTYVLLFLRPPTSALPSRPPTEIIASFGLIAGGIIFMASSSDTIDGMISYDLDVMFTFTITLGLVGIIMAWVISLLAIKSWAVRSERRHKFRLLM